MRSHRPKLLALVLSGLCGCQSPAPVPSPATQPAPPVARKTSFDLPARNNSLALLNELLNEEKHLSKILIIKRASPRLKELVKNISAAADRGAKMLEAMMDKDSGLKLPGNGLPPGEKATREGLAKTKQHELLRSKGAEFEFQLLLTQVEALSYAAQLAQVAGDNEPQPERAGEFSRLAAQLTQLHERVIARLRR